MRCYNSRGAAAHTCPDSPLARLDNDAVGSMTGRLNTANDFAGDGIKEAMTRTTSLGLAALVTASALIGTLAPSVAADADRGARVEPLHTLGHVSYESADALTVTTRGVAVALWPSGPLDAGSLNIIHASIRRPGHGWTPARRVGSSPAGEPVHVVPLAGGRAAATWLSSSGAVVLRMWRPHTGWAPRRVLAPLRSAPGVPALASDPAARTWAVGWAQGTGSLTGTEIRVVVHRGDRRRSTVLTTGDCPSSLGRLAVGDRRDVVATWTDVEGTCTLAESQAVASVLVAGTSAWTTQAIGGCDSFCPSLQPFRQAGRLALAEHTFTEVRGALHRGTTFWKHDGSGHWTRRPGDYPFVISDVVANDRGDLVTCARERHEQLYVRPAGGAWRRVELPGLRADACAVNDHRRVAVIGNRMSGTRRLALMWGRVRQSTLTHQHVFRAGRRGSIGTSPRVALTASGVVTGLATAIRDGKRPRLLGMRAVLSATAPREPAG